VEEGRYALCSTEIQGCRRDSNGFQHTCSSNLSNQFATNTNFLNSRELRQMITSLGDQGSQVRVLSPRFAADSTAVKPFPADFSGFHLAGISNSAGTSTYSLIWAFPTKPL
jgi:hypothetical protein